MMTIAQLLEVSQAALAPILAVGGLYIAWRQHRLDALKSRQALYDRRLGLFNDTMRFLALVSGDGNPSVDEILQFRSKADEAYFLFGPGVCKYLDDVFHRALELRKLQRRLGPGGTEDQTSREAAIARDSELFIWFEEQLRQARTRFATQLSMND